MDKNKTLTVAEFKQWLQGIRDMLGEDWVPSADQWKRVCDKLDLLDDRVPLQPFQSFPSGIPMTMSTPSMPTAPPTGPVRPAGPSSLNVQSIPPALPVPSTVPGGMPALRGPFATDNKAAPAQTPTIDTSNGQYTSSFA